MSALIPITRICIVILVLMTGIQLDLSAQKINTEKKEIILKKVKELIKTKYVNESTSNLIIDSLNTKEYNQSTIKEFRVQLSRDLKKISQDKHFKIIYNADNNFSNAISSNSKRNNYGFTKIEIRSGNIGYLRIESFEDPKSAGKIAHAALSFLSNTEGLIIDVRDNNGGRKAMVQLLLSYFFEESSKHLYSIYGRKEEFHGYTEAYVQGDKMDKLPLYILINNDTFSAAELFAFILQNQQRATLIGENTGGGGHTIGNYPLGYGFSMNLPVGKVIEPISRKSWEKVGVLPDVEIKSNLSLEKAHLMALETQKARVLDSKSTAYFNLQWQIDILSSTVHPIEISKDLLKSYAGTYGNRIVSYKEGKLYYQGRAGIAMTELIPIDTTTFRFDVVDYFRIQFELDTKNRVNGLKGLYDDGYQDFSKKN